MSALTWLARPGTANRGVAMLTVTFGSFAGIWLAQHSPERAAAEVGFVLLAATALLIGWSNAASP